MWHVLGLVRTHKVYVYENGGGSLGVRLHCQRCRHLAVARPPAPLVAAIPPVLQADTPNATAICQTSTPACVHEPTCAGTPALRPCSATALSSVFISSHGGMRGWQGRGLRCA